MSFTHLLLDLISDHEVDGELATECEVISTIFSNKGEGVVKRIRATQLKSLEDNRPKRPLEDVRYVHLSGHGDKDGPGFICDEVSWKELAQELHYFVAPLPDGVERALCLSCCHSETGVNELGKALKSRFSALYYFSNEKVGFDDAMVAWSLFYHRKPVEYPTRKLVIIDEEGQKARVNAPQLINSVIPDIGIRGPKRPSDCK